SLNAWFPFSTGRVNLSIILMIASKPSSLAVQNHDQWGSWLHQHTENRQFSSLLRPRRERPSCRAAEQCDEVAAFHSITSSMRACSIGGTSRPSALAVFRFTTHSYLVGCTTGRSLAFSPFRMRPA